MDVGSGILVGFAGRANLDIDALSFIFLLHDFTVAISNVRYKYQPTDNSISRTLLAPQATFRNEGKDPIGWDFSNEVTRTNSWSWSQSTVFTFTHNVTVTAGFFKLVEAQSNTTWELTVESKNESSVTVAVKFKWAINGTLKPGQVIVATASADSGQADVPYTATVTISAPRSNYKIVYQEDGVLENAVYLFAEAAYREVEQNDVAAGSVAAVQGKHHPGPGHIVESSDAVELTDVGYHVQPRSSVEHTMAKT